MPTRKQINPISPALDFRQVEHFIGTGNSGSSGLISAGSGTGASITQIVAQPNSPGVVRLFTGSTAAGTWFIRYPQVFYPPYNLSKQNIKLSMRWRVPATTSATQGCIWTLGFSNATTAAEPAEGAYFYMDHTEGVIYAATSAVNVRSYVTMDVLAINQWVEGTILLAHDGTVKFACQTVEDAGFNIATISTNIPTAGLGVLIGIAKTLGLVGRTLDLDYIAIEGNRNEVISTVY